jgi:hypothetical protein
MMEVGGLKVCAVWWMHKTFLLKLLEEFVSFLLQNCWTKGQYRSILLLNNTASHERSGPGEVNSFHDGICPHTANNATQVLEQFNCE